MVLYSYRDKKREIKIPTTLTPNLAELMGIIVGDGHIRFIENSKYDIHIYGDMNEDKEYHLNHIRYLLKDVFNLKETPDIVYEDEHLRRTNISSKAIVTFLIERGMHYGNKMNSTHLIPNIIYAASKEIKAAFIRGLADTDFSITFKRRKTVKCPYHFYPSIVTNFGNESLAHDTVSLIKSLGIYASSCRTRVKRNGKIFLGHSVSVVGKKNLQKWMETICFNNYKHTTKYDIWDTYGFCPPYTTLQERDDVLNGKTDLIQQYLNYTSK